jgi:hypothetical protein
MTTDVMATQPLTVTAEQRTLIQQTLAPEATNVELELFFYDNRRRGVHPLDRLIHFTKRQGRYVPITSIHFMRAKADEGGRAGMEKPLFAGKEAQADYDCAVTVYKFVQREKVPYIGVAKWKEYYPGNEKEGFMWRKMPSHMLAKCAEANALRLAFPRELAGLHIEEEAHVLDEPQPVASEAAPPLTLKDKLKAKVEQTTDQSASKVTNEPDTDADVRAQAQVADEAPSHAEADALIAQRDLEQEYRARFTTTFGAEANRIQRELVADARLTHETKECLYTDYAKALKTKAVR